MCDCTDHKDEIPAYDAQAIESKWMKAWEDSNLFAVDTDESKPKKYVLEMFPYPSGDLHMGHARNYTIGDAMARQARMRGFDVLHPIGFDAFGLPAENAAIKHNTQAAAWTYKNMDQALATMKRMGFSYDLDRMVKTCSPDYYRWGQWIFEKMWEKGLVYRKKNPVNWCPTCKTVLANEQVTEGKCWRCGTEPEKRDLEQWYFKITEYSQELLDDLEKLPGWPERVKQMQGNWIGRSEGAEVDFTLCDQDGEPIEGDEGKITVFTTRADTLFGVSFFLLPPDLLTSTSFAAILLGLQNAYAPCDLGFQLSFCAVLGVQAAATLARTEQREAQDKPAAVKALCQVAEPVQTAALASLATLPVLVAHGMAASLVGVLCNLLVVWMVQPALQLGILLLVCSAVPFLAAITNLTALVLSLWLKGLLWLVRRCAALPFASICLPQRYTLFALAVLGALAVCFWHARRLRLYLPAATLCTVLAVGLGVWMQRDVVQINLVGASNNPCVVCVQNGQAVVFFRGGESNWSAVQNYLAGRSRQEPALVVDLRAKPTQMEFSAAEIVTVQELADFTTRPVLDGLTLDLYHNKSANLAVLGVGERHIAVGAGRLELAEPVRVDVLCAPGTLSESVRPDAILYTAAAPRWLDDAAGCTLRYGEDTPGLTLRPGRSMIWEEAQTIAVQ